MAGRKPRKFTGLNITTEPDPDDEGKFRWVATDDAGAIIEQKGSYVAERNARSGAVNWAKKFVGETHEVREGPREPQYIAEARKQAAQLDKAAEKARARAQAIKDQVAFLERIADNYEASAEVLRRGFEATLS